VCLYSVKYCSQVVQLGDATYNTTDHHFDTYVAYTLVPALSGRQTNDKIGQFRLSIKSANKSLSSVMQKSAEFVCHQNRPILLSK